MYALGQLLLKITFLSCLDRLLFDFCTLLNLKSTFIFSLIKLMYFTILEPQLIFTFSSLLFGSIQTHNFILSVSKERL